MNTEMSVACLFMIEPPVKHLQDRRVAEGMGFVSPPLASGTPELAIFQCILATLFTVNDVVAN